MHLIKRSVLALLLLSAVSANAQHYYKDILAVEQTVSTQKLYAAEKVKKVTLKSLDADRTVTRNFMCYQLVSPDFTQLTTITRTDFSGNSNMKTFFDTNGRLLQVKDSTDGNVTTTSYVYSPQGKLQSLTTTIRSLKDAFEQKEEHQWQYTSKGAPEQMVRILNGKDTTLVTFITDEAGKVLEEKTIFSPRRSETIYYYYNQEGRLSDIVRYNTKARRLLPDYMFEYDNAGKVVKTVHIPNNSSNYLTWVYQYDAAGLKLSETALDKQKEMMGRITYAYER